MSYRAIATRLRNSGSSRCAPSLHSKRLGYTDRLGRSRHAIQLHRDCWQSASTLAEPQGWVIPILKAQTFAL